MNLANKSFVVALSGGVDSVVLLNFLSKTQLETPIRVVHVNHHLSNNANSWADFCQQLCQDKNLDYTQLDVFIKSKKNLEKTARDLRYQVLFDNLKPNEILATAHHQSDQAETILLQLFRGAGVAGLSAMPATALKHHRPLLHWSKERVINYAKTHNLSWIEDDSNQNTDFRRNFLRLDIVPRLKKTFQGLDKTLARSANIQAETLLLLTELAQDDIKNHQLLSNDKLNILSLKKLSKPRQKNVLRHHFFQHNISQPSEKILKQILLQLDTDVQKNVLIQWVNNQLRCYQNEIYLNNTTPDFCPLTNHLNSQIGLDILTNQPIKRIRLPNKTHSQQLKKLYQEHKIPTWHRSKLAMYYQDGQLIAIQGIGFCQLADL